MSQFSFVKYLFLSATISLSLGCQEKKASVVKEVDKAPQTQSLPEPETKIESGVFGQIVSACGEGQPCLPNVGRIVTVTGHASLQTETNEFGIYELELDPGEYNLCAERFEDGSPLEKICQPIMVKKSAIQWDLCNACMAEGWRER